MTAGELTDVRAVITGGASGIGLATASHFADRGARVACLDRTTSGNAGFEDRRVLMIMADVTDDASVRAGVDRAAEALGGLTVVVNNAGIGALGTVEHNDDDEWRHILDVNVLGVVRTTRAALPYLRRAAATGSDAAVVNLCSIAATVGLPERALYSASKGAVLSLTLAMAADHIHEGIRVNCVNPGTVDTPWISRLLDEASDREREKRLLTTRQPTGRLVSAEEVAGAIAYLAGPFARDTTGTSIAVDGGMQGLRLHPT